MAPGCSSASATQTHIAIVGSRSYSRPDLVQACVASLPGGSVVVSGGARGVDSVAEAAAKAAGLETVVFHADWESLGRRAGPIRNEQIIQRADRVMAFWDGRSRGTLNALVLAERAGLPIEIFGPQGEAMPLAAALEVAQELGVYRSIAVGEGRAAAAKRADEP